MLYPHLTGIGKEIEPTVLVEIGPAVQVEIALPVSRHTTPLVLLGIEMVVLTPHTLEVDPGMTVLITQIHPA